ncbi:MAG: PilN domain-containing protein [Solirubrobacterales bacterium]
MVGALVAVLVGVTALVLTGNQISDRKSEVTQLEREDAVASARVERLAAYTQFQTLHEQRVATVTSLADSRFDWERVMRELSLVLPSNVWLTSLDASASAGAEGGASAEGGGSLTASIAGPSLTISGCATGHEAVAGFVTALEDIDGVTRVGVESSEVTGQGEGAAGGSSEGCGTRASNAQFNLAVAFDAAPVPTTSTEAGVPTPAEQAETSAAETSEGH